jgi:hypothetical protein
MDIKIRISFYLADTEKNIIFLYKVIKEVYNNTRGQNLFADINPKIPCYIFANFIVSKFLYNKGESYG